MGIYNCSDLDCIHTPLAVRYAICTHCVYLTGRGVATKGYLYVYIHTVYKYHFGAYLTGRAVYTQT
jgi:hypothetical protein